MPQRNSWESDTYQRLIYTNKDEARTTMAVDLTPCRLMGLQHIYNAPCAPANNVDRPGKGPREADKWRMISNNVVTSAVVKTSGSCPGGMALACGYAEQDRSLISSINFPQLAQLSNHSPRCSRRANFDAAAMVIS